MRVAASLVAALLLAASPSPGPVAVYDEAMELVRKHFHDRTRLGPGWEEAVAQRRALLAMPGAGEAEVVAHANDVLGRLGASHTALYSDGDQTYWALRSVFSHQLDGWRVRQIGAWFELAGDRWYARDVFEDSPAEAAGLRPGDEILSADGAELEPVRSFQQVPAATVVLRSRPGEATRSVRVETRLESFQETMLRATVRSTRVVGRKGRRIGYIHLWAGTHPRFLAALRRAVADVGRRTDALVLDLRGGFGGAHPGYVEPFEELSEGDSPRPLRHRWRKPLVVLVDGGTRSGKEWVAYLLDRAGRTLVGTRTAGAFLGGRPYPLAGGKYLLYLAVSGAGPAGVDLEGKGVEPDILVPMPRRLQAGADSQLEAAFDEAARQASRVP